MTERQSLPTRHLTFSERYGYEQLPGPMQLEQLSDDLRREIWNLFHNYFSIQEEKYFVFSSIPLDVFRPFEYALGKVLKKPEDEINLSQIPKKKGLELFKLSILNLNFDRLLSLTELIVNRTPDGSRFAQGIAELFESHSAAYWLEITRKPYQFIPRSSPEQGHAVQQAIKTVEESGMTGASIHLRKAIECINSQQYSDSITDSIHAVESVARLISPKKANTLGPALNSLENAGVINHKVLKNAFSKLYDYTSDEQGIRHALLDKDSPEVGLDEAMFMFGACASFAAYLVNKHQQLKKQQDAAQ